MKFHYRLVDDLLTEDEFERRVEEKVMESGDLLDEQTAAMLVVRDLGRAHIRIRDLTAVTSLACFFAKVLSIGEPREFERPDGTKGLVARVMVGDETGRARLTLWDEKAAAVSELEAGAVVEILGRPKGGGTTPDVTVLAIQEAACEITCEDTPDDPGTTVAGVLEVRLISVGEPRTFTRRNGSPGEMLEAVVGNEKGVFRLVAWAPALLCGVEPGESIFIKGALARDNDRGVEYSVDETASVAPSGRQINITMNRVSEVEEGGSYSLSGTVVSVQHARTFTTRSGRPSKVRNLVFADETAEIPVVIWGEKADERLVPGDRIEVYNAVGRRARSGGIELHLSWGSALLILEHEEEIVEIEGTIIPTGEGISIEAGNSCYLLERVIPIGYLVRARGTVQRGVFRPDFLEYMQPDLGSLKRRLDRFTPQI